MAIVSHFFFFLFRVLSNKNISRLLMIGVISINKTTNDGNNDNINTDDDG